jgi:hypothetical protein
MKKPFSIEQIGHRDYPLSMLPTLIPKIKNLKEAVDFYGFQATRSAFIAAYLGERYGYGCGDQGHGKALKAANRAARLTHCEALGYNDCTSINF